MMEWIILLFLACTSTSVALAVGGPFTVFTGGDISDRNNSLYLFLKEKVKSETVLDTSTNYSSPCTETIRENLVKFLKRAEKAEIGFNKRHKQDGDDGDEDGVGGVVAGAGNQINALGGTLFPQLVRTFTQLQNIIQVGLNVTGDKDVTSLVARLSGNVVQHIAQGNRPLTTTALPINYLNQLNLYQQAQRLQSYYPNHPNQMNWAGPPRPTVSILRTEPPRRGGTFLQNALFDRFKTTTSLPKIINWNQN